MIYIIQAIRLSVCENIYPNQEEKNTKGLGTGPKSKKIKLKGGRGVPPTEAWSDLYKKTSFGMLSAIPIQSTTFQPEYLD